MIRILCTCSGGVTGSRTAWLKDASSKVRQFANPQDAKAEADRLNSKMNHEGSLAIFQYTVVEGE